MKNQFKPIILFVLVSLAVVLVAGVWLLLDSRKSDYNGLVVPENKDPIENRLPGTAPSDMFSAEIPTDTEVLPVAPSLSVSMPDFNHLHLVGIATDPIGSFAVIHNEKTNSQGLFRTGDSVDGSVLLTIQAEKVILGYENRLFTLMRESVPPEVREDIPEESFRDDYQVYQLSVSEQADIEAAWAETQTLMCQIELSQHMENDTPAGVTVQQVTAGSVFEGIGLMPGDVILGVDGMEITIADDAMEIYNCLRTRHAVQLTVKRNNETLTLEYKGGLRQ